MIKNPISILLFFLCFLNVSCSSQTMVEMQPKEFLEKSSQENTILLDVRTPEEYAEGHLKGAILINYHDENFKEQVAKLDTNKSVYVYCKVGSRSGSAREIMLKSGFKNVINLDGGIVAWKKAGYPIE